MRRSRAQRDALMRNLRMSGKLGTSHEGHRRVPLPEALRGLPPPRAEPRLPAREETRYVAQLLLDLTVPVRFIGVAGNKLLVVVPGRSIPKRADGTPDTTSAAWRSNHLLGRIVEEAIVRLVPGRGKPDDVTPEGNDFRVVVEEPRQALPAQAPEQEARPAPTKLAPVPPPPPAPGPKYLSHREENTLVRGKLRAAGLPVIHVGHGRGTAYGWLHIKLQGKRVPRTPEGRYDTQSPEWAYNRDLYARAHAIISSEIPRRSTEHDDSMTDYNQSNFTITVQEPDEVSER